jgi:hypothetical protein
MKFLLAAALLLQPVLAPVAHAQDIEDLDGGGKGKTKTKTSEGKPQKDEIIREIERGLYAKANLGVAAYFLNHGGGILSSGTQLNLSIGSDFIDRERSSMAWEVGLAQGIHNGAPWEITADLINSGALPPAAAIQGDTRTYAVTGAVEYSVYPSRRFGIGARAGGGLMFMPILLGREFYNTEVVEEFGFVPSAHQGVHPLVLAGPTMEYYTKLSHLSLGADVDAMYVLGFDLGVMATGYLKYTF